MSRSDAGASRGGQGNPAGRGSGDIGPVAARRARPVTRLGDLCPPYALPTALLVAGLGLKSPTIVRSWKDPNARATWLVLLFASAVFVSVAPSSIHRLNTLTRSSAPPASP
ncbi:hypothetical protein ACIQ6Y_35340 [Streptomyces sp. NPDC096205]|uniref:hypothetical protein n=1 Tax=Streptomyces sp. NPDC096205 TaxID=3366081 RepID=UPI00380793F4